MTTDRDYFIAASECHLMGDFSEISYYPDVRRWFRSAMMGVARVWGAPPVPAPPRAAELIKQMDESGIDVGFGLRESMMERAGTSVIDVRLERELRGLGNIE